MNPHDTPPLPPGTRIGGDVVEGVLGSGSFATVYRVRGPDGHRSALKLLPLDEGAVRAARALREVSLGSRLRHPNLARQLGMGQWPEDKPRYVWVKMRLVEGPTLEKWGLRPGRTPGEVVDRMVEVARGLAVAHDARVVHRDVKGDNILVDEDTGQAVVVVDFGAGYHEGDATLTLVVHPSEAERQVEVLLQPRTLASYREGEQRALAEVQRCHREKERLQTESAGQVGLRGLFAQELLGEEGVPSKGLEESLSARPGNTLTTTEPHSYRADIERGEGGREGVRLAVVQVLRNTGRTPWTPAGALLVGPQGREWKALGVWPLEPIPPGKKQRVVVEVECTREAARGAFTLKLWSQEGGGQVELFDGVTFP